MATVTGMTAAAMQAIADGTVVSATVDSNGDLILTKHDGTTANAGHVKGADGVDGSDGSDGSDAPAHKVANYNRAANYVQNDIVNFAGRLYKSKTANVDKRPPFYSNDWEPVSPAPNGWVQTDPFFLRKDWDQWDLFWGTGGASRVYTSVAGEFVTGHRALKLIIPAGASQRIYPKELNLVGGGERVVTVVKARRLTGTAVTIRGTLQQATEDGNPEPFGSDSLDVSAEEGMQSVGSAWEDFTFSNTATYARPQARVNVVVVNNGESTAEVLIDQIYTHDPGTLSLISKYVPEPTWQSWTPVILGTTTNPTMGNSTVVGRYFQVGKMVTLNVYIQFGSTFSPGAGAYTIPTLPVAPTADYWQNLQVACSSMTPAGDLNGYAKIEGSIGIARIHVYTGSTTASLVALTASGGFAPASGGRLLINGTYEAA